MASSHPELYAVFDRMEASAVKPNQPDPESKTEIEKKDTSADRTTRSHGRKV